MNPVQIRPGDHLAVKVLKVVAAIGALAALVTGSLFFEAMTEPFMQFWYLAFIWFTPVMLVVIAVLWLRSRIRRLWVRARPR